MNRAFYVLLISLFATAGFCGRYDVATFTHADLDRAMGEAGCYVDGPTPTRINFHRNTSGNLFYAIKEETHQEVAVLPESSKCNNLTSDILDLWRNEKGLVVAQLLSLDTHRMLLVGDFNPMHPLYIRGKRFDVERTGRYFIVSQGTSSTVCSVDKPYRPLHQLDIDAQRIFTRQKALLVVGGNPATNALEARMVRITPSGINEGSPIIIPNMAAGIRVLDYNEKTDELLLSGVTASGQAAFAIYNMSSGKGESVDAHKAGDDLAMFMPDAAVRKTVTGTSGIITGSKKLFGSVLSLGQK